MQLTKEYFDEVISTLATRSELASIRIDLQELNEKVDRIDKRDKEDSDFFRSIFMGHERRIKKLEKMVKT